MQRPAAAPVDRYHLWFDLRDGVKDLDLADAIEAMLDHLVDEAKISTWLLERRKLGFGIPEVGEWHVVIETRNLAQLDEAFQAVTPRSGKMEKLHAAVWSKVTGLKTALYRDFPDQNRL